MWPAYYVLAIVTALLMPTMAQANQIYTFDTLPTDGVVAGSPGSTIGWGYSIRNESVTDWLVTTELNAGLFLNGTPDGSFFDFPAIAPNTTVTVPFDQATNTGLYALTWDSTAPLGFVNHDAFTLSAEWWNGDPIGGGTFLIAADDLNTAYTATVSPSPVPLPSTMALFSAGLMGFGYMVYRNQRKNSYIPF